MNLPIVLLLNAREEFDEAFDWYEEKQPGLGLDFLDCIEAVFKRISLNPETYERVDEDIRRAIVQRFPYLVIYRVESDRIVVVAIFHSKRDPKVWQSRL